jgi:hypothetical protein
MSRQRGHLKQGRGEYIRMGRPLSSVAGSDNSNNHMKRSRSPSLNSSMAHQHDNDHTSSGWGYKIQWFDKHGCSLGYAPKSSLGWTSSQSPPRSSPHGHSSRTHGALSSRHPVSCPSEAPSSNKPNPSK